MENDGASEWASNDLCIGCVHNHLINLILKARTAKWTRELWLFFLSFIIIYRPWIRVFPFHSYIVYPARFFFSLVGRACSWCFSRPTISSIFKRGIEASGMVIYLIIAYDLRLISSVINIIGWKPVIWRCWIMLNT